MEELDLLTTGGQGKTSRQQRAKEQQTNVEAMQWQAFEIEQQMVVELDLPPGPGHSGRLRVKVKPGQQPRRLAKAVAKRYKLESELVGPIEEQLQQQIDGKSKILAAIEEDMQAPGVALDAVLKVPVDSSKGKRGDKEGLSKYDILKRKLAAARKQEKSLQEKRNEVQYRLTQERMRKVRAAS